jgi:hypothetical protein
MNRASCTAHLRALFTALTVSIAWLGLESPARAQGGTCASPPVLTTAGDTGTTVGAPDSVTTLPLGCNGSYTNVAGPDVFYELDVAAGNSFTVTVTPTGPYDTSIYLMAPTCGDGADCENGWGADDFGAGGAETLSLSGLAPGTYYLGVDSFYGAGDPGGREAGNYAVTVSGSLGMIATTTSLQAPPATVYGQSASITATVMGFIGSPVGSVAFAVDGGTPTPVSVNAMGQATFSTSALGVGDHSVTATYLADPPYETSSAMTTQTVNLAAAATTLMSSGSPSTFGAPVTITVNVSAVAPGAGTPTGTVAFSIDGTPLSTPVAISGGAATLVTSPVILGAGTHTIGAIYSGDANFSGSTAAPLTQVVTGGATTTTAMAAPSPAIALEAVALTATVAPTPPATGTPSGIVTFSDGANGLGTATLVSGVATLPSAFHAGTHSITAVYAGDTTFLGSTSAPQSEVVDQAATTTALAASANPSPLGANLVLTASVSVNAPGNGAPTGTVTFSSGATTLGTGMLDAGGHATFATTSLGTGMVSITAAYSGDSDRSASTSAPLSERIDAEGATVSLTSSANPSSLGASVTFTATLSVQAGGATPTGIVIFADGTTTLGNGTLTAGVATFATSTLGGGPHTITATYGGDGTYSGGATASLLETIAPAATATTLSAAPNPTSVGSPITFTVTVSSAGGTPTGTVGFADGTSSLGTATLTGGTTSLTIPSLSAGPHPIQAAYSGDTSFASSVSAAVVEQVTGGPDAGVGDSGTQGGADASLGDGGIAASEGGVTPADGGLDASDAEGVDSGVSEDGAALQGDGAAEGDAMAFGDAIAQGDATASDAAADAATSGDGGSEDAAVSEGDGGESSKSGSCSCRTVGGSGAGSSLTALGIFAVVVGAFGTRRRSRRQSSLAAERHSAP